MSLSVTQRFALAALSPEGKTSVLKKGNNGICLVASCIWDLLFSKVVSLNEKGGMVISGSLPKSVEYCRPIYEELRVKTGILPQKIILNYITELTDKRMINLASGVVNELIHDGFLVASEPMGKLGQKKWRIEGNPLEKDISALKEFSVSQTMIDEDTLMLAILLIESRLVKKMFGAVETKDLKANISKRDALHLQPDLRNIIDLVELEIATVNSAVAVVSILT